MAPSPFATAVAHAKFSKQILAGVPPTDYNIENYMQNLAEQKRVIRIPAKLSDEQIKAEIEDLLL